MCARRACRQDSKRLYQGSLPNSEQMDRRGWDIYPWFRGQANSTKPLLPGLYRKGRLSTYEYNFREDFVHKALPFLSDTTFVHPSSDWDWYFLMQHYGVPTRLIDWSEGSLIALYFALFYKRDDDDTNPCVWMMNPFGFNSAMCKDPAIRSYSYATLKPYMDGINKSELMPQYPAAFFPSFNSKRIVVQKGCFTIHGSDQTPLEKLLGIDNHLHRIEIRYRETNLIKADLVLSGITETTLFPELGSLSKELAEYWKDDE
jgi:hypothetical protein